MIQQFTYTASPWGKTGAGWMVFQQSRNLPPEAAKVLYPIYRYEGDSDSAGRAGSQVQFAYLPSDADEGAILAQTTFTGTRWFDPRPGDFFAHVLLLDKDAVLQSAAAGINPVRLFCSPGLQSAFPETLKAKALKIFRKEIAWEPPPELPEGTSLAAMPTNPSLSFETIVGRLSGRSASKLGAIIRTVMLRAMGKGAAPVVFDARNAVCPSIMALVLDFLPPTWRARTWFAVQFRESALRRLPAFQSLSFYGTETNQPSDPDTGVVSGVDFSQDPFRFRNMEEVRSFKRQLDILAQEVSLDAYKGLLACREVVSGRVADVRKLREAVTFAGQFPGLKDKMAEGLASAFAGGGGKDGGNAIVLTARFELGMGAVGNAARTICRECARDRLSFAGALQVLEGDGAKLAFLDEVYAATNAANGLPGLAAMWMGCGEETKRLVPAEGKVRPFGRFAALVDGFVEIRNNARQKPAKDAEGLLKEVEEAEKVLGSNFEGMQEAKKTLQQQIDREKKEAEYQKALEKVTGFKELKAFANAASSLGIEKDRIREAGLKKVPLKKLWEGKGKIEAEGLKSAVEAFEAIGVDTTTILNSVSGDRLLDALDALVAIGASRDEIIHRALEVAKKAAENRGYEMGVRAAQRRAEEEARERNRGHIWVVLKRILIVVALMVLCFAAGYGLRCVTGKEGKKTAEKTEEPQEIAAEAVADVGMEKTAHALPTHESRPSSPDQGVEPGQAGGTSSATEKETGGFLGGDGTGDEAAEWNKIIQEKEKQDVADPDGWRADVQNHNNLDNKRPVHPPSYPRNRNAGLAAGNAGRQTRFEERKGIPGPGQGGGSPKGQGQGLGAGGAAPGSGADGVPPPVPAPVQESGENVGDAESAGGIQAVAGEIALSGKEEGANGGVGPTGIHGGGGAGIRTGGNGR